MNAKELRQAAEIAKLSDEPLMQVMADHILATVQEEPNMSGGTLEAERDKAVELLRMSLHSGVGVQDYQLREAIESFLASIGGEGK